MTPSSGMTARPGLLAAAGVAGLAALSGFAAGDSLGAGVVAALATLAAGAVAHSAARRASASPAAAEVSDELGDSARLRRIAASLPGSVTFQAVADLDGDPRLAALGEEARKVLGVDAAEALRRPDLVFDQIVDADRPLAELAWEKSRGRGVPVYVEVRHRLPDGAQRWMSWSARPFATPGGGRAWDGVITDVTLLKQAEEARRASDERYRLYAENLPVLAWILRRDGGIAFQSRKALPYSALFEDGAESVVHPDDRAGAAAFFAMLDQSAESRTEIRLGGADGEHRWHQFSSVAVGGDPEGDIRLVTAVDIEDTKRAEEMQTRLAGLMEQRVNEATLKLREQMEDRQRVQDRMLRSQKLEALGRLTGGIAHDLNNKLQVISANLDVVVKHLKDQPKLQRGLLAALVATDRAAALIGKLLGFAKRQDVRTETVDIEERLRSVAELLDRSLPGDAVEIEVEIEEGLWPVEVDTSQFEAAIVNLAVNARDAMPTGGRLAIEARNFHAWEARTPEMKLVGDCVRVTMTDTGAGMSPEVVERAFEPFFTTKEEGRGSGLGLSQVYGFVRQIGGLVEVESAPGHGASVSLFLPRAGAVARIGDRPVLEEYLDDETPPEAVGEVLVVDDEVDVAEALRVLLEQMGYRTRIAVGGEAALDAIAERRPDLVLTDLAMPGGMDGVALAEEVKLRHPGLPCLILTGNAAVARTGNWPVVHKPITSVKLDAAVREHIARVRSAGADVVPFRGRSGGE
jgi:PAS domain S-box-containing protein